MMRPTGRIVLDGVYARCHTLNNEIVTRLIRLGGLLLMLFGPNLVFRLRRVLAQALK